MPSRLLRATLQCQEDLVARLLATGTTRTEIARVAGVDVTLVSKWTSEREDGREIPLAALLRLADCYGWDVVAGPLAGPAGWTIARRDEAPVPVLVGSVRLVEGAAALLVEAHAALSDGRISGEERVALLRRLRELGQVTSALTSALEDRR